MPGPIDHTNPDVAMLRELLNRRPRDYPAVAGAPAMRDPLDATDNPDLPSVPHPSGFRPDPIITGTPRLANAVNNVFKVAPELRGRVDRISTAPTPGIIERMNDADIHPLNANYLDAIGQFMPRQKGMEQSEIWLRNENFYPRDESLVKTVGHEMGHVGNKRQHGYMVPRDTDMDLIEMLSARVLDPTKR